MGDYIEGRRAVEEALSLGVEIRRAYVLADGGRREEPVRGSARKTKPKGTDHTLNRLVDKLRKSGIKVEEVDRDKLDAMSHKLGSHGAHQGIVCEIPEFRYSDIVQVSRQAAQSEDALILVLDHVTDEGNLGAIIRTAEVVGAACVVIPSKRAAQVTSAVYKTSAGAALHIPICRVPNIVSAIELLKKEGFWVAGASERAQTDVWHAPLHGRIALVAGSEGDGLSRLVLESCDFLVSLPQRGKVSSLNVAQATTAICYEWLRQVSSREGSAGV